MPAWTRKELGFRLEVARLLVNRSRWWMWSLRAVFRTQRRSARRAELGMALLLAIALPAVAMRPPAPSSAGVAATAAVPHSPDVDLPSPGPSPSPVAQVGSDGVRVSSWSGAAFVSQHYGCGAVPAPPALSAGYFPRVVIPRVGINVEIHEGNGQSPPDHVWVAWHYPGSAEPGDFGNSYLYAHAHGYPAGSATGLFWPLHYMHNCDAVYVYTSPTTAFRYQTVNVNLSWPANNTSPLQPTNDERVTLQTCNAWGDNDPKTIVVALRVDPPPPPPPPSSSGGAQGSSSGSGSSGGSAGGAAGGGSGTSGGGSSSGGNPPPQPQPSPTPAVVPPCLLNCHGEDAVEPAATRTPAAR
jgi:sortase (surface protein transpeptidase)